MRKDVLKGVLWGVLLCGVGIGSIAVDRMLHSTRAEAAVPVPSQPAAEPAPAPEADMLAVAAPTPVPEPVVEVRPVATPLVATPKAKSAPVPTPPSLPPLTEASIYPHPAPPTVARPQDLRAAVLVEQPPMAPIVTPPPASASVANSSESEQKDSPNPATRAIRSVGRVLGIGRKDEKQVKGAK